MQEIDLSQVPFAPWLEDVLQQVCKQDVSSIAIVCCNTDGSVGTAYYNATCGDKGTMAWQLLLDGIWEMILNNKDLLKEELEAEPEPGEDGEEDA